MTADFGGQGGHWAFAHPGKIRCAQNYAFANTVSAGNFRDAVSNGSSVLAKTSRLAGAFCLDWGLPVWPGSLHFGMDMPSGLGTSRLGGGASRLGLGLPYRLRLPVCTGASHLGWGFRLGREVLTWAGASHQNGGLLSRLRASRLDWGTSSGRRGLPFCWGPPVWTRAYRLGGGASLLGGRTSRLDRGPLIWTGGHLD